MAFPFPSPRLRATMRNWLRTNARTETVLIVITLPQIYRTVHCGLQYEKSEMKSRILKTVRAVSSSVHDDNDSGETIDFVQILGGAGTFPYYSYSIYSGWLERSSWIQRFLRWNLSVRSPLSLSAVFLPSLVLPFALGALLFSYVRFNLISSLWRRFAYFDTRCDRSARVNITHIFRPCRRYLLGLRVGISVVRGETTQSVWNISFPLVSFDYYCYYYCFNGIGSHREWSRRLTAMVSRARWGR